MIKLNILLPTYRYKKGVEKILTSISQTRNKSIHVYLFDNTENNSIYLLYQKYKKKLKINYFKNVPTINASENWNRAISYINSKKENIYNYSILLHQDEYFGSKDFFKELFNQIREKKYPEIISMNTYVKYNNKYFNKIHTLKTQREFLHKYFKNYIIYRNYFGPLSSIIFKTNKFLPKFSRNLRWFIDVEFYLKIINFNYRWHFSELYLVSDQKNNFSLTNRLKKSNFNKIKKAEKNDFKLKVPLVYRILYFIIDFPMWCLIRIYNKLYLILCRYD